MAHASSFLLRYYWSGKTFSDKRRTLIRGKAAKRSYGVLVPPLRHRPIQAEDTDAFLSLLSAWVTNASL